MECIEKLGVTLDRLNHSHKFKKENINQKKLSGMTKISPGRTGMFAEMSPS
jgi:hypothetical protein